MDDEAARERRRQAKYSHMAQHQEVAKLVAYAAFRGELPAVGPLLIRRPDFGLQNERAQRLADEEARWLATLRKRGEEGARAARRKPALSSSRSALDQGSAEPERRGLSGLGGGANAARERVKVRAQRSRELAVALSNAPVVAAALHFRRSHPYSADHELPIAPPAPAQQRAGMRGEPPQQPAPCRVASASTVASRARLEHRHSSTAPAAPAPAPHPTRSRPLRGAAPRPSSPSAPACASSVCASSPAAAQGLPSPPHGLPARPATGELGRGSATSSASDAAASLGRARASSARGSTAALPDGAPRWGGPGLASGTWESGGGGGGSNVGFGSAVPARPLERSAHWPASPSGRFWAVGEGAPPPAVDALPRAEAAARPRSDVAPKLAPPGAAKWPQQPPPAVGPHLGPGAYAGAYGARARSPWDLRPSERLRPSAAFSARELRRGAAAGAARDAMSADATGAANAAGRGKAGAALQVGADGVIATPPPLVPGSEYSGFTLAATAKRRAPSHGLYARSPPRSADEAAAARRGGGDADTGGHARVTISQRQAISLERLRVRLEQLERAGLRDPANDSIHARPSSAKSRRVQRATLVRLGGAALPTGAKVTPDALTAVSSKVLDASEALG